MIFTAGGVKSCYGKVMSRPALEWLESHGVYAAYSTLADNIINREGTGLCPMESAVLGISDNEEAIGTLKSKLNELKSLTN